MRGEHDRAAGDRVAVRFYRHRLVAELVGRAALEDHPAAIGDRAGEAGEVLVRMEPRLIDETHTGAADKRHGIDQFRVEAEFGRQRRLLTKRVNAIRAGAERCV